MASSSSPRSVDHSDDEDDYGALMSTVSPNTSPTVSRKRNGDHLDTDDDNLPLPSLDLALRANGNHRLRPEQMTALEVFMADPIPVQLGKIFALGLATDNTLAKFQAAKPPFEINSALKTNITRAVNAMLCSSKASQYKGETGKNDVQSLLIRHRWGNFVIGTEHDKAAMDVILKFIGETYTQSRSIIKKEIVKSLEVPVPSGSRKKHTPSLRPKEAHTTIYQLTKLIVQKLSGGKGVSIPVSAALCSRVALMRKWHLKKLENSIKNTDTDDYWELVDLDLQAIRTKAREGTVDPAEIAKRVARAFASILDKDRKRHGSNPNEEIPEAATVTDDGAISYQADIDEALDARNRGHNLETTPDVEDSGAGAENP
ncbi:hypothetical protein B0H13DRAFT_1892282 [Mycena leptocephala]|nr:hypothetical protein B0H13DRAFT_1892282 [Mycena leptocephala]